MIGLLANEVDPSDSTLWATPWLLVHVQVTVPPTATVSTAGFAVPLWPLMNTIRPLFPTVTDPAGPPPPPPPAPPPEVPVPVLLPQPPSAASANTPMPSARKRMRSSSARLAGAGLFPVDEQEPAGRGELRLTRSRQD